MKKVMLFFIAILVLIFTGCSGSTDAAVDDTDSATAKSFLENMPDLGFELPASLAGVEDSSSSGVSFALGLTDGEAATSSDFPMVESNSSQNLKGSISMAEGIMEAAKSFAEGIASYDLHEGDIIQADSTMTVYVESISDTEFKFAMTNPFYADTSLTQYIYFIVSINDSGKYEVTLYLDSFAIAITYAADGTTIASQEYSDTYEYVKLVEGSSIVFASKETGGSYPMSFALMSEFNSDGSVNMYMDMDSVNPSIGTPDTVVAWGDDTNGGIYYYIDMTDGGSSFQYEYQDYCNSSGDLLLQKQSVSGAYSMSANYYPLKYLLPLAGSYAGYDLLTEVTANVTNPTVDDYTFYVDLNTNGTIDTGTDAQLENVSTDSFWAYEDGEFTSVRCPLVAISSTIPDYYTFSYSDNITAVDSELDSMISSYSFDCSDYDSFLTGVPSDIKDQLQ